MAKKRERETTGPRGGTTTVTPSGMVKKNMWISWEDAERLRALAFELRISEADIIRQGLAVVLDKRVKYEYFGKGGNKGE